MDQVQEARQKMIETVTEFFEERPELLRGNVALAEEIEYFISARDTLEDLSGNQDRALTGIASEKALVRQELAKAVVICSSQLYSHGVRTKNEELRHQFDCVPSDVLRLADVDLRKSARRAIVAVDEHQAGLAACGHTSAQREALILQSNRFRKLIRAPRKAVTNRADVTAEVARTLDDATERLRSHLDPLMQQFWGTDRPLYDTYRKARRLVDLPRQRLTDEEKAKAKERAMQRRSEKLAAPSLARNAEPVAPAANGAVDLAG